MDTLQTQWSWLLQITKCIHVHLKENAAYSQVSAHSCRLSRVRHVFMRALIKTPFFLPSTVFQGGRWHLLEAEEGARDYPQQVHLRQEHPHWQPHWSPENPRGTTILCFFSSKQLAVYIEPVEVKYCVSVSLSVPQKEKERIMENKRQVHSLVNKSKTIVRLKPRNPEEKSSGPVIIEAICDFKQDQVGNILSHCHTRTHTNRH